jgi:hypothetical protein
MSAVGVCDRLACALCSRLMLNLRDPKVNGYAMEAGNTYGSPSSAEPLALTTVMNDVSTFQTEAEPIGKCPRFAMVAHKVIFVLLRRVRH